MTPRTEPPSEEMTSKLLAEGFQRSAPAVNALSDPLADTPMVVTLEQLRPYEFNPRVTRNPLYDEIKASIRERGLDAPPAITRRPNEPHYVIRNGGNTRLAILRELWTETKDEQFYRVACLFRPWPLRGEIVALTGHLVENELHGGLTFIERALGVEKARQLYEQEDGKPLSQSNLSRRLTADGYPLSQSSISRMQEAVIHLLPAIPSLLYGGLGRTQVERLTALRNAGLRVWDQHHGDRHVSSGFIEVFHDILASFDGDPTHFSMGRVQDELVGEIASLLQINYDTVMLELDQTEVRHRLLTSEPTRQVLDPPPSNMDTPVGPILVEPKLATPSPTANAEASALLPEVVKEATDTSDTSPRAAQKPNVKQPPEPQPSTSTDRLQTIQRLVTEQVTEPAPPEMNTLGAPIDGLFPVADAWSIEPSLDSIGALRVHIAQLARELAAQANITLWVNDVDDGFGYSCQQVTQPPSTQGNAVLDLLSLLSDTHQPDPLAALLQGTTPSADLPRLSDEALLKLFRLIRLSRRLVDWLALPADSAETPRIL